MYKPGLPIGSFLFYAGMGIFAGYLWGWYSNNGETLSLMSFITALVLLFIIKKAKDMHANDIIARSELAREHRSDDEERLRLQLQLMKEEVGSQVEYDFTSEDFDTDARRLMLGLIHKVKGRSKKKKVSGAALVDAFLRGIK